MSDIDDLYRYDRSLDPKQVMDQLYEHTDVWRIFNRLLVTTHTLDLEGQGYTGRQHVSAKELEDRHYVVFWDLSHELGILWLDEVMLANLDPRGGAPRINSGGVSHVASVSQLTITERQLLRKQLLRCKLPTHPKWADPVHVMPRNIEVTMPSPASVPMKVSLAIQFAFPPSEESKRSD